MKQYMPGRALKHSNISVCGINACEAIHAREGIETNLSVDFTVPVIEAIHAREGIETFMQLKDSALLLRSNTCPGGH